ncbi:MAG: hypothetical protein WB677_08585, partial [Xanthobacteraceae bacterium]
MNIATFNKTAVSLGLGRIERAILAIVDVEDEYEQSYAAEDLAIDIFRPEKPYPEDWWPTQAQHVAVIRAMNSLARKFPEPTRGTAEVGGTGVTFIGRFMLVQVFVHGAEGGAVVG